jgi:plasmid stabilization system protein ParE
MSLSSNCWPLSPSQTEWGFMSGFRLEQPDIGESLALLAEQPGIGTKYTGARAGTVRRLFMSRVGYFLYYRTSGDVLEVLAFWHASRGKQPRL